MHYKHVVFDEQKFPAETGNQTTVPEEDVQLQYGNCALDEPLCPILPQMNHEIADPNGTESLIALNRNKTSFEEPHVVVESDEEYALEMEKSSTK